MDFITRENASLARLIKETLEYVPRGCLSEFVISFHLLSTKYYKQKSLAKKQDWEGLQRVKPMLQLKVCQSGEEENVYPLYSQQRAKIAKYASECGNTAAVRHFSKDFSFLGECTVSTCYIIFSEITFYCLFHEHTIVLLFMKIAFFYLHINFQNYGSMFRKCGMLTVMSIIEKPLLVSEEKKRCRDG